MAKYYITSAIPYVNAKPHIGHALEFIQADTIRRYRKLVGDDVLYLCGSDENALKNVQAAEKAGKPVQAFVDENAKLFEALAQNLSIYFDIFQKGSDTKNHFSSSQKLWQHCSKSGDIYKKTYKGLYCIGCETFYSPDELDENGECFEHPGKKLEEIEEENYFFKLSKYQNQLQEIISSNQLAIVPEFRKKEVLSFLSQPLQDISISRSNKRAKDWGVPVPGDPTQRMYVWFDALNIYQSGIGFGWDEQNYNKWWPADLHVIGKGIIRFHAVYWPAFLLSAGLNLPKKLFVHEYFTVNGQKMSKTLGNVIDPNDMIEKFGADGLRYYCLAKISPFADGDFSEEKCKESYNSDLANGLGNLVARVAKLCEKNSVTIDADFQPRVTASLENSGYYTHFEQFEFNLVLEAIWKEIKAIDIQINNDQPWTLDRIDVTPLLKKYVAEIRNIAYALQPFLPETARKIEEQFKGPLVKSQTPLFPRI